ncbi:MAG: SDR family oxidoreductase [Hyphomicrobiales bacterium]|nr:SDR family oxidoreductase [Hyphomicrobiales bacterium]MCP4998768.1 SDR family oxidoreductase [Hyphomicrobiales bacterium]
MSDLTGKTVVVTGASKGIGAAIAKSLGASGANVVAHYATDRSGAAGAVSDIPEDRHTLIQADFANPVEADAFWSKAKEWKGRVDVLVANAAIMRIGGGVDAPDSEWDDVWDEALRVNVLAPARLMRNAVRSFETQGGGIIICLSSWAANRGASNPDSIAYAASKAAISAAAKTIARAYATRNILTYLVSPGVVRTRMSEDFAASHGGEEAITAGLQMKEWVPPEDLGELVAFLATGKVRHLSGATIDVNGASYVR